VTAQDWRMLCLAWGRAWAGVLALIAHRAEFGIDPEVEARAVASLCEEAA
jgi:hypothetical protein